jgi:Mg-chelatase subunit ChlD
MKDLQNKLKKSLSMILTLSLLITSMPILSASVFAENEEETKYDNPWDYTIFGNSINIPVNIMSGSINIAGDIHANDSIIGLGHEINIDGTAEAGDTVNLGDTSGNGSNDISVDEIVTNAEHIQLPNIYDSILYNEKNKASYSASTTEEIMQKSLISNTEIEISDDEPIDAVTLKKAGAFGAGFLTEVYENPEDWADVLPVFVDDRELEPDGNNKISLIDLTNNSYFAAVQELSVDESKYKDYNKLAGSVFMNNLNSGYTSDYLNSLKSNNPVFNICADNTTTLNAVWDNSAVNPSAAEDAEKIIATGGNLTLNGDYDDLTELKITGYGNVQLIGNYENLEYIYSTGWGNLNLAGNFPSLKCVYVPGGQLLLGTANVSFNTDGAKIINENGTITLYTAKDTTITDSTIITNSNMSIRGDGLSESKFIVNGSTFAATALTLGDMKDINLEYFDNIPNFFSQSGLSIVNCDFEKMQGFFMSRNGKMILADSDIKLFSGFLFAQQGINKNSTIATEGVYADTSSFIQLTGVTTGTYRPSGQTVGGIRKIQYAQMPTNASLITGVSQFTTQVKQQKNADDEYVDVYENGLNSDEEPIIYIMSEEDITIDVDSFKTPAGRRMIIASKNGDITIRATDVDFEGVLYAPNGTVQVRATGELKTKGRIYGDIVDLSASTLNINSNDDDLNKNLLDIENQIIFVLPPFTYFEKKDMYIYDDDSAQIDYILYSNKEVDEIQASTINYVDGNPVGSTFWTSNSHNNGKLFSLEYSQILDGLNTLQIKVKFTDNTYYTEEYTIYRLDPNNTDTDDDGLTDDEEFFSDTDANDSDSDDDGLSDFEEVYKTITDPLKSDTDGNNVTDGNEDFDDDGLTNAQEMQYKTDCYSEDTDDDGLTDLYEVTQTYNDYDEDLGNKTDPTSYDTDNDGLTDGEEVNTYYTNPLMADTDEDDIEDGLEINIGFNPLIADEEDQDGFITVTKAVSEDEQDDNVTASVTIRLTKENLRNIEIVNASQYNSNWNSSMAGYMGAPYDFDCPENFESATITFTYDITATYSTTIDGPAWCEDLTIDGFEPTIYYYNESTCEWEELGNQTVDYLTGTVQASVTHFSKYILLNKRGVQKAEDLAEELITRANNQALSDMEIVMIIDDSGTMAIPVSQTETRMEAAKRVANNFINSLCETSDAQQTKPQVAVISFADLDPLSTTPVLTKDKSLLISKICGLNANYGSTPLGAIINKGLEVFTTGSNSAKYIILLSDGHREGESETFLAGAIEDAKTANVKIYTIGFSNDVDRNELENNIAIPTGGFYSFATDYDTLVDAYGETLNDLYKIDTDNDGLPDYYEEFGFYTTDGTFITTDPEDADTDNDDLSDGDEVIMEFREGRYRFIMVSNPTANEREQTEIIIDNIISINNSTKEIEYNWDEIENILNKTETNVSADEYAALISVIDSMYKSTNEEIDTVNFTKLLKLGYQYKDTTSENVERYLPKKVMVNLAVLYNRYVEILALNNPNSLFVDEDKKLYSRICMAKLLIAVVREKYCLNSSSLYFNYDWDENFGGKINEYFWTLESGNPTDFYDENFTDGVHGYTLKLINARINDTSNGSVWIGGKYYPVAVSDFTCNEDIISHLSQVRLISKLEQSYSEEIAENMGSFILNSVLKIALKSSTANVYVAAANMVYTGYKIYQNNNRVVALLDSIKKESVFKAMEVGYCLTIIGSTKKNGLSMDFIMVNETMLQIKVNAYNNYYGNQSGFQMVTRNSLENELRLMFENGEVGESLDEFVTWCSGTLSTIASYSDQLDQLLSTYKTIHRTNQSLDNITIKRLTPKQINKLDEVYRGEKTIREIKL